MVQIQQHLLIQETWLKIEPNRNEEEPWDNICFSDSNYVGNPVTRSVSGFILYVLGVPMFLQSKAERSMTLSSQEAEWVALLETIN